MSLDLVLARTSPDTSAPALLSVLFGLSPDAARHLLARRLLASDEARALLDASPMMLRSLANDLVAREVLEQGTISGSVVWPATITARAANGFPDDLFVCRRSERSSDIPENRVFLYALAQLERASRDLERYGTPLDELPVITEVKQLGRDARALKRNRRLDAVSKVSGSVSNDIRLTKRGRRAPAYRVAVDLVQRSRGPLRPEEFLGLVDRNTELLCSLAVAALAVVDELTGRQPMLEERDGRLWAGPLSFAHPGPRTLERWPSVQIGDRVLAISPPGERRNSPLTLEEQKRYAADEAPIVAVTDPNDPDDLATIRRIAERGLRAATVA